MPRRRGFRSSIAPPLPSVLVLLNHPVKFLESMELETYIQTHLAYEKSRFERNPAAAEKGRIWMETIENAPRSLDAIQSLMDAKEVAMNKTSDIRELQHLDREWSALLWLQSLILQSREGKLLQS